MKKLVVLAAFALAGFTGSAAACDWNREASNEPTVLADCTGTQCKTEAPPQDPTVTQESSKTGQPTQDRTKEESWPVLTTVADCGNGGCK
jgi:hypothetical protein